MYVQIYLGCFKQERFGCVSAVALSGRFGHDSVSARIYICTYILIHKPEVRGHVHVTRSVVFNISCIGHLQKHKTFCNTKPRSVWFS